MIKKEKIYDWRGKIIGTIEEDTSTGNKLIRDFYGRIKGNYIKKLNITRDFYGIPVAKGDQLQMLLYNNKK